MNGLELSRGFFEAYGRKLLEEDFAEILPFLAVGFVGSGSEHFGFDDAVSRDHDFEPGFCIFLPGEEVIDRRTAFKLERAYAKLPKEYGGVKRLPISPVGGNRNGVIRTADFYTKAAGTADGVLSVKEWLTIPDYALAEAVNGAVFFDNYGEFTRIRERLLAMPQDIRLKRIAGSLFLMAQAGQYNFARTLLHGEPEAAQLALTEFVQSAMRTWFLLRGKYMPYYKWSFKALRLLPGGKELAGQLSYLLFADHKDRDTAEKKQEKIEEIASVFIRALEKKALTDAACTDLEKLAYSVNDKITDSGIRNLHVLCAVNDQ